MSSGTVTWSYKYVGVILLTIQQASMPLMTRAARYRKKDEVFITTANVFVMELIKLATCSAILIIKEGSFSKFLNQCKKAVIDDPLETAKVCLPALIYTIQNNLYYIALSHLEATTFCVCFQLLFFLTFLICSQPKRAAITLTYQLKTFTTALLLRMMLNKKLSCQQWIALFLLAAGVCDIQLQYQPPVSKQNIEQSVFIGFIAVVTMCFTSAFAGVYLEKVLKQSDVSIWMQNVRLALLGLPLSAISMYLNDYDAIEQDGMFRGFDYIVWAMTITNSIGGLLISVVIKYADNILKAFAQSAAIVGAAVGSWILFDFSPNTFFTVGAIAVVSSIYLYNGYPYKTQQQRII